MKKTLFLITLALLGGLTTPQSHAQTITDSLMRVQIRSEVQTNPLRSNSAAVLRKVLLNMTDLIKNGSTSGGSVEDDYIQSLTTSQLRSRDDEPVSLVYVSDRGNLYEYTNEDTTSAESATVIIDALGRRYHKTTVGNSLQRLIRISWGYDFGGDFDQNDFN